MVHRVRKFTTRSLIKLAKNLGRRWRITIPSIGYYDIDVSVKNVDGKDFGNLERPNQSIPSSNSYLTPSGSKNRLKDLPIDYHRASTDVLKENGNGWYVNKNDNEKAMRRQH